MQKAIISLARQTRRIPHNHNIFLTNRQFYGSQHSNIYFRNISNINPITSLNYSTGQQERPNLREEFETFQKTQKVEKESTTFTPEQKIERSEEMTGIEAEERPPIENISEEERGRIFYEQSKEEHTKTKSRMRKEFKMMGKGGQELKFGNVVEEIKVKVKEFKTQDVKDKVSEKISEKKLWAKEKTQFIGDYKQKFIDYKEVKRIERVKQQEIKIKKEREEVNNGATTTTEEVHTETVQRKKTVEIFRDNYESKKDIVVNKMEEVNEKVQVKYPRVCETTLKGYNNFQDVWSRTFPNQERNVKRKIARRKNEAKRLRELELTETEITTLQEGIPEWKRTALELASNQDIKDDSTWEKVRNKITTTKAFQDFQKTDDYKNVVEFNKELNEFRENLKDEMDSTQNPVVQVSREAYNTVFKESVTSRAIIEMRKYDPDFDIFDMGREVEYLFRDMFNAYLLGDTEYLAIICGEGSFAYYDTLIKRRIDEKIEPLIKEIIDISGVEFMTAHLTENSYPNFIFSLRIQTIDCNLSQVDGQIISGDEGNLMQSQYVVSVQKHEKPDLETTGHYWEIREVVETGKFKQLI